MMREASEPDTHLFDTAELCQRQLKAKTRYFEFLRQPSMSAGLYRLLTSQEDPQSPHEQDELYYVLAGSASFDASGTRTVVHAGSVLFVPAGCDHRFLDITADLVVL